MPDELPVVWHLDAAKIKPFFHSPADRLTLIKYIMNFYEHGILNLEQTKRSFEKVCESENTTDEDVNYLLKKLKINSETRIDEILECLGLKDKLNKS